MHPSVPRFGGSWQRPAGNRLRSVVWVQLQCPRPAATCPTIVLAFWATWESPTWRMADVLEEAMSAVAPGTLSMELCPVSHDELSPNSRFESGRKSLFALRWPWHLGIERSLFGPGRNGHDSCPDQENWHEPSRRHDRRGRAHIA